MRLNKTSLEAIRDHARDDFPNEACGVLLRRGKRIVARRCANIDKKPARFFEIAQEELDQCRAEGEIVAIYHSHPHRTSKPSDADTAHCNVGDHPWVIVGIRRNETQEFELDDPVVISPEDLPYEGRPYVEGVYDCYGLACDYYKRELGVELSDSYDRVPNFWKKNLKLFETNFENEGFVQVCGEPRVGDAFLIKMDAGDANHCAIYVGNDRILHHCLDRLSRTDLYGGSTWQKHTILHLRHKSQC